MSGMSDVAEMKITKKSSRTSPSTRFMVNGFRCIRWMAALGARTKPPTAMERATAIEMA